MPKPIGPQLTLLWILTDAAWLCTCQQFLLLVNAACVYSHHFAHTVHTKDTLSLMQMAVANTVTHITAPFQPQRIHPAPGDVFAPRGVIGKFYRALLSDSLLQDHE